MDATFNCSYGISLSQGLFPRLSKFPHSPSKQGVPRILYLEHFNIIFTFFNYLHTSALSLESHLFSFCRKSISDFVLVGMTCSKCQLVPHSKEHLCDHLGSNPDSSVCESSGQVHHIPTVSLSFGGK